MTALDAMSAAARSGQAGRLMIALVPVSHPDLEPIRIRESLFAIGRTEAPFDAYPPGLAADLSRRHARIFCEHGAVYFAELGSKNGSTVNGVPVRQAITTLRSGDLLGLGKTLVYRVEFDQDALQPPHTRLASLTLVPEDPGTSLQPIVVTVFPFMISKADEAFARYKDSEPAQVNYLSRRHAHLFLKGGALHVEDLGSTNGTFVNGTRLEEHAVPLHDGDLVAFGGRHFVYRIVLAWEAVARDPTLTRIGAAGAGATTAAADADRTTFVAAADSFLDIFCVDAAATDPDAPRALDTDASAPQDERTAPPQGRAAAMLSGLHTALGGKGPLSMRRLRYGGMAALAAVVLLAWALVGLNRPVSEVEGLLADGAYAQAAAQADEALADDPDNGRLRALGTEALLKANLPSWMAALKAGRYQEAQRRLAGMRGHARHNPELQPLLAELDWITGLEAFVAQRGGAGAPPRGPGDGARIERILKEWEDQDEAHQRAFQTIAAHVPAFRDTYADALSDIRRLALSRTQR